MKASNNQTSGRRVLFANFPADGHFNPLTGLAVHLVKLGYDVRWYTSKSYAQQLQKLKIHHYAFKKAVDVSDGNFDSVYPGREKRKSQLGKLKFDLIHAFISSFIVPLPSFYQHPKFVLIIHKHFYMQRYNSFYMIHKGLRQMLYQTASHILQTDFCEAEAAAEIVPQITAVLDLFDGHAHTEDNFVLPAIEAFEPSVATLFEEEHVQDHALSNRMRALLNMFHHAVSSEEKREMGSAIRLAFTAFLVFNLQHMAKEELVLNNLLWKYYTDEQLRAITKKIIAHIPQEKTQQYNRWMMRGLSNNEIVDWLKNIKNEAPDVVFESMLGLAEKELSPGRWSAVLEEITEGALLA